LIPQIIKPNRRIAAAVKRLLLQAQGEAGRAFLRQEGSGAQGSGYLLSRLGNQQPTDGKIPVGFI